MKIETNEINNIIIKDCKGKTIETLNPIKIEKIGENLVVRKSYENCKKNKF